MSAEKTEMLQPFSSVPMPPCATSPAPLMVARPSFTAATFTTSFVLQIGKLSPAAPMKRVPSGMQSLVGPSATTAAGVPGGMLDADAAEPFGAGASGVTLGTPAVATCAGVASSELTCARAVSSSELWSRVSCSSEVTRACSASSASSTPGSAAGLLVSTAGEAVMEGCAEGAVAGIDGDCTVAAVACAAEALVLLPRSETDAL